jgi:hypothetical protein
MRLGERYKSDIAPCSGYKNQHLNQWSGNLDPVSVALALILPAS